jgi:hypothetical protein
MSGGVLAQLFAQARQEGADLATLRAIAEEAGEIGGRRALTGLELSDDAASQDLRELREMLRAWRDAKRSAVKGVLGWCVRMALALLLIGIAVKTGFGGWVKP